MADAPISTVVNVQISLQAVGINRAGFGIPNFLTDEAPLASWGSELIREYASTDEILEDWASSTEVAKAAAKIFGQTPRVPTMKVSLEGARTAQQVEIVFSGAIITGNTVGAFTISSGGQLYTITATPFNTSNAQTLTDLATKIQASVPIGTASSDGVDTLTLTAAKAGVDFSVSDITITGGVTQATVDSNTTVANVGGVDSLAAISEQDDAWYGLLWNETDEDLVYTVAEYIESKRKIFLTVSQDADIIDANDTDDIGSTLSLATFDRTAVCYNADVSDHFDAGFMGRLFPYDPGSETWAHKTIAGITRDDLTSAQRAAALDKNVNIYVTIAGLNKTLWGTMASGLFIDLRRGADWLWAQIEEGIYLKLTSVLKVPFTQKGINIVEEVVRAKLDNAIGVGLLSGDPFDAANGIMTPYIVNFPKIEEISQQDKADRVLSGGSFQAKFAGAIHRVSILNGTISV